MTRAVLLAVALALASCGGPHAHHATPTPAHRASGRLPSAADELQALLERRAQALQAGDAAALAATSTGRQRARDRTAAHRARALRLRAVTLVPAGPARARLSYRLAGAAGTFGATRAVRTVRTPAGLRVAFERAPRGRDRVPWDVAAYRRQSTRHFLLLAPRGLRADGLAAELEIGRRRVARALPGARVPDRLAVIVAASVAQTRALTREIRGVESLSAIAEASVRVSGPAQRVTQVAGQRVIVVWPDYEKLGAIGRLTVVTHELTHAALAGRTSGRTPAWLAEGVALFASGDRRADQFGGLLAGVALVGIGPTQRRVALNTASLTALARPDAIGRRTGVAQAAAYAFASAAAFAIVERHGRAGLMRLLAAFSDPALRGPPGRALQARAIRQTLGERASTLAGQIRRYSLLHAV